MTDTERAFVTSLRAAEMHWFFVQGSLAARHELWVPAVVALLTGVENSIRVTLRQLAGQRLLDDAELGTTLSNSLLRKASEAGLPVRKLAFPGEVDFGSKIGANQYHAEIVRVRHNLCHGNALEWVNRELGDDNAFFTPECVRPLTQLLLALSVEWTESLGSFRASKGLR